MAPAENAELNTDTDTNAATAATSSEDNAGSSNEVTTDTDTDDNANALEVDSTTEDKTDVDAKTEDKAESESEDKTTESTDDEEDDDLTDEEAGKLDSKIKAKLSKKNREAANLRDRLGKESLRADRAEVALALGLDADAATLLAGDTREAIEESAEKLLVLLGHKERVTPAGLPKEKSGKQHVSVPDSEVSLDEIGARMFKR